MKRNKHKVTKLYFKPTDFSVSNNNANLLIKTATGIHTMSTNKFWQEKKIQIYKYKKGDTWIPRLSNHQFVQERK
jgi:hypothetical protein